ncbi:MAG: hypothetical protein HC846_12610 [Blastocatellia bacterium]|nr:hypothetical protein [Blastocatellia bacterium]
MWRIPKTNSWIEFTRACANDGCTQDFFASECDDFGEPDYLTFGLSAIIIGKSGFAPPAATNAAEPPPITIKSYFSARFRVYSNSIFFNLSLNL